jgi:hypothetical protein
MKPKRSWRRNLRERHARVMIARREGQQKRLAAIELAFVTLEEMLPEDRRPIADLLDEFDARKLLR